MGIFQLQMQEFKSDASFSDWMVNWTFHNFITSHHLIGACQHSQEEEPNWTTQQKWDRTACPLQHITSQKLKTPLKGRRLRSWVGHLGVLLVISNTLFWIGTLNCLHPPQQFRLPTCTQGKDQSCVCPPLLLHLQCTLLLFEGLKLMIIEFHETPGSPSSISFIVKIQYQ